MSNFQQRVSLLVIVLCACGAGQRGTTSTPRTGLGEEWSFSVTETSPNPIEGEAASYVEVRRSSSGFQWRVDAQGAWSPLVRDASDLSHQLAAIDWSALTAVKQDIVGGFPLQLRLVQPGGAVDVRRHRQELSREMLDVVEQTQSTVAEAARSAAASPTPATPSSLEPRSAAEAASKLLCERTRGVWAMVDACQPTRCEGLPTEPSSCLAVPHPGCDCGPGKMFTNAGCEPNPACSAN